MGETTAVAHFPIPPFTHSVVALVLAAGASTRMGAPKQVLPFGGKTLLCHVVDRWLATSVNEIVVVLGCRAEELRRSLLPSFRSRLRTTVNPRWESGMLSSVQCGLRALKENPTAFALALGDQPGMATSVIEELLQAQRKNPGRIVIPRADGQRGHPVIFDARFAGEILALTLEQTVREVVDRDAERALYVAVDSSDHLEDIDTPEDYERIRKRIG